ncbi:MAG: hypothetical protein FD189_1510 [Elusimicrobia bacterium]|nr:MAG: hypothetical protein FD154_1727 [Elusimicrobiota bacterium]KAF0155177.1 MAG: hypothetical protein FD189_1510 [Elusimicrobiota bacterium]
MRMNSKKFLQHKVQKLKNRILEEKNTFHHVVSLSDYEWSIYPSAVATKVPKEAAGYSSALFF